MTLEERQAISRQRRAERILGEQSAAGDGRKIDADHPHAARATLPDQRALSGRNQLSDVDQAAHLAALDSLGIRTMPYGAGSIVAIVSDVDGSTRARYASYIGQLVNRAGLDFGDSTWLTPQFIHQTRASQIGVGFGFFHRDFDYGDAEAAGSFDHTRTFNESLIEFHRGNVDHFHSFLPNGPRMIALRPAGGEAERTVFRTRKFAMKGFTGCDKLYLRGICVIGRPGRTIDIAAITVNAEGGAGQYRATDERIVRGRTFAIFEPREDARLAAGAPHFLDVAEVTVTSNGAQAADAIDQVVLMSASGGLMRARLSLLRQDYNIETPLVTDHSGFHFRDWFTAPRRDRFITALASEGGDDALHAVHGTIHDDAGEELFDTEADSPDSLAPILGSFVGAFGGAYVVPAGGVAGSQQGWGPLNLVTPALTRTGDGVYVAQRTLPPPAGEMAHINRSHADTVAPRITRILDCAADAPGAVWPLYTHAGGIPPWRGEGNVVQREQPPPDPYFDPAPIDRLQDAAFGITGTIPPHARVWFARATAVYDYALMLRSLPANTVRIDADVVAITAWADRILDQAMPRSPAMLNGVTFYCDDPARAEIRLDGRALDVARNPPDATGRASVTVTETDLRFAVFGRLDPVRRSAEDARVGGGAWDWHDDHGRLTPIGAAAVTLRIAQHGWHPIGAQALAFRLRRATRSGIGILLETETGGRFFFGDAALCPPDIDARYGLTRHAAPEGAWRTIVVPFADLEWRDGAAPGGPMPNHALRAITLLAQDGPADFADLVFLRPRSTRLSQRSAPRHCLAGTVPDFAPGQAVTLCGADGQGARICAVDQRGAFCFAGVAPGIYRLSTENAAGRCIDRRGEFVEVTGDIATITLSRDG